MTLDEQQTCQIDDQTIAAMTVTSELADTVVVPAECAADDEIFWQMMSKRATGCELGYDVESDGRLAKLKREVKERSGLCESATSRSIYSARFIVEIAAERHFKLMEHARNSMNEIFTENDILVLLNSAMNEVSQLSFRLNMASTVAHDHGIESLEELPENSSLKILMDKLLSLEFYQDMALTELTEIFWRSRGKQSISNFGLVLKK